VGRFIAGTPPILSMAAIEPGIDLVLAAGLEAIRFKSMALTEHLAYLWEHHLRHLGVTMNSPRDAMIRGSHVSFGHPCAYQIDRALIEEKQVIPDFRRPDNIRFGVAPLYNSFAEVEEGALRMRDVIESEAYLRYGTEAVGVT
jgi:kynureninase